MNETTGEILIITGGRDYGTFKPDAPITAADRARVELEISYLEAILDRFHKLNPVAVFITGCARGADTLGKNWAESRGIKVLPFPVTSAEWSKSRGAGFARNRRMVAEGKPTRCIAFPGGKGTADQIQVCRKAGVPTWQVPPPNAAHRFLPKTDDFHL
jgi:hypothetical protein